MSPRDQKLARSHNTTVIALLFTSMIPASVSANRMIHPPLLQWNPETIATCAAWMEPYRGATTCSAFRTTFGFSPEQFHEFNPSVGIDCQGWEELQSYCVADDVRQEQYYATQTDPVMSSLFPRPTKTPTPTAVVMVDGTPLPSPRAWTASGCFPGDKVLAERVEVSVNMSHQVCREQCWARMAGKVSLLVGLRNGTECWCGKELLVDYETQDFSLNGCHGDKSGVLCSAKNGELCGGVEHMDVYQAVVIYGTGLAWGMKPQQTMASTSTSGAAAAAPTGTSGSNGSSGNGQQQSAASGEMRPRGMALAVVLCLSVVMLGLA